MCHWETNDSSLFTLRVIVVVPSCTLRNYQQTTFIQLKIPFSQKCFSIFWIIPVLWKFLSLDKDPSFVRERTLLSDTRILLDVLSSSLIPAFHPATPPLLPVSVTSSGFFGGVTKCDSLVWFCYFVCFGMVYGKSPKDCAYSAPFPHMTRHEPFIALGAINLHMILSTGPQNLLSNLEIDCKIEGFFFYLLVYFWGLISLFLSISILLGFLFTK